MVWVVSLQKEALASRKEKDFEADKDQNKITIECRSKKKRIFKNPIAQNRKIPLKPLFIAAKTQPVGGWFRV